MREFYQPDLNFLVIKLKERESTVDRERIVFENL